MNAMKHRPEVDGLRAVAVVPVVLFHADLGCPGGYVGVDVFFVISGYLITALILQAMAAGTFTLVQFWERRVRRIAPALVAMVAATLLAGGFLFLPEDLYLLGKSAIAQSLMVANVHFFGRSGYFDGGVEGDPLLHTWSLAVEEQFYLVLPLALLALRRCSTRTTGLVLTGVLISSLIASVYGAYAFPSATFYLLPTRAWELLLGSLIALRVLAPGESPGAERFENSSMLHRPPATRRGLRRGGPWLREALTALGLAMIAFAVFAYDRNTPFPGAAALLPCLGTAAVIWANAPTLTRCARLLTTRPMTFIGQISYSLYLWHWPVLVYAKYWANPELSPLQRWLLVAVSVGLAIVSWRFIETPFRRGMLLTERRRLFGTATAALACLLLAGVGIKAGHGLPFRMSDEVNAYAQGKQDKAFLKNVSLEDARAGRFVDIGTGSGDIDLMVWGDSHAMAVLPVLHELCAEHVLHGAAATHSATAPLVGFASPSPYGLKHDSIDYNAAVLDFVRQRRIGNVLIVAKWHTYIRDAADAEVIGSHLRATVRALEDCGARVWIMQEVPHQQHDVPRALAKARLVGQDVRRVGVSLATHRTRVSSAEQAIRQAIGPGVILLDPAEQLVDGDGVCRTERDGRALYRDEHHLSVTGAQELRPLFEPIVRPRVAERD
jgi:peptidoglycan/LPS O-acetylase OafA/YrhL